MAKWKKKGTEGKFPFFLIYTVIFGFMLWVVFRYFWENGRTFVWAQDGWKQHYRALLYYSKWLRELFSRLFITHDFHLPSYSFSIGYGADILTTLHYYAIGDPLTLFCVFVPESAMLHFYELLIMLRIYLAGISFACYCFYRKKTSMYAVLAGTFVYIFCGYTLFAGVRHPYFLNPMIYLPFLFLGVEKLWREKKPGWFIAGVFISAVSNFYFFYMIVLLTVLYVAFRLVSVYRRAQWREAVGKVLQLAGYALVGVSLGAVILLPVVAMFLGNSRLGTGYQFDFWYSSKYYKAFLPDLLTAASPGKWTRLGYAVIFVPAVVMLFLDIFKNIVRRFKKLPPTTQKDLVGEADAPFGRGISKGALGAGFLLLTLFLLIPAAGYALNGFAYVANRWVWGYSMLVAFIVVAMWDEMVRAAPKKFLFVVSISAAYMLSCMILRKNISAAGKLNLNISMILLICCLACLLCASLANARRQKRGMSFQDGKIPFICQTALLVLTLASIGGMADCQYSENGGNYIADFKLRDNFQKNVAVSETGPVAEASGEEVEFFRYTGRKFTANSSLGSPFSGTQFYWSLANGLIWNYFVEQDLLEVSSFNYQALDDRAALCALAGVKYYVAGKGGEAYVPYGYEKVELSQKYIKKYEVYRNPLALGLGYTYKNYILEEDYKAMDPLSRQEAMLLGLVLPDAGGVDGFSARTVYKTAQEIDFAMDFSEKQIVRDGTSFHVKKKGAKLNFTFEGLPECETYLVLTGLDYDWADGNDVLQSMILSVSAQDEDGKMLEKTFRYKGASYMFYAGQHDYIINLCYSDAKKVSATLTFPKKGVYHLEQVKVVCQPLGLYEDAVRELGREKLVNTNLHNDNSVAATNYVTGEITLSTPKLLALAIPYSDGWEAYVDGKKQKLLRANTMYCALALEAGSHSIELRYRTPGLAAGFAISLCGVIVLSGLTLAGKRRRSPNSE